MAEQNSIQKALGEKFSFTVRNRSANDIVIALLAACFNTTKAVYVPGVGEHDAPTIKLVQNDASAIVGAGYLVDAVAIDGEIAPTVTMVPANSKMTYAHFREYVKNYGKLCKEIIIQVSNSDVFANTMEIVKATPLQGAAIQSFNLQDFKSLTQQDTTKIIIPVGDLDLTFDTLIMMNFPAGRDVSITFKF